MDLGNFLKCLFSKHCQFVKRGLGFSYLVPHQFHSLGMVIAWKVLCGSQTRMATLAKSVFLRFSLNLPLLPATASAIPGLLVYSQSHPVPHPPHPLPTSMKAKKIFIGVNNKKTCHNIWSHFN